MPLEFSYSDVEAVLVRLNRVADDKRVAFRARLKHFQRLGLPRGANTGTGKRAPYSFPMLLQLCIATQLAQTGMAPKRTVATVEGNWSEILFNCFAALLSKAEADSCKPKLSNRIALIVSPEALRDLSVEGEKEFDYYETVEFADVSQLAKFIAADQPGPIPLVGEVYRHIVIQLWPLLQAIEWHLIDLRPELTHVRLRQDLEEHLIERDRQIKEGAKAIRESVRGRNKKA